MLFHMNYETEPAINLTRDIIDTGSFGESSQRKQSDGPGARIHGRPEIVGKRNDRHTNPDTVVDVQQLAELLVRIQTIDPRLLEGSVTTSQARGELPVQHSSHDTPNKNTLIPNPPMDVTTTIFNINITFLGVVATVLVGLFSSGRRYPHPDFGYQLFRFVVCMMALCLNLAAIVCRGRLRLAKNYLKGTVIALLTVITSWLLSNLSNLPPLFPEDWNRHVALISIQSILVMIVAAIIANIPM